MPKEAASTGRETDEAMNRALAAETKAREDVARCRTEAAATIDQAHAKARAIQARADRRISRVRNYCLTEAESQVSALHAGRSPEQAANEVQAQLRQRFRTAVERLAARLTGGETG